MISARARLCVRVREQPARRARTLAVLLLVAFSFGCAARNRLDRSVAVQRSDTEAALWIGIAEETEASAPVLLFLEGDGSDCQAFSERLWRRFLVRYTGAFVLVRPVTRVNRLCGEDREAWSRLDFLHRLEELEGLVGSVKRALPGRPVYLLGHSAGAHLAILHATKHPDTIAGVVNLSGGLDELSGVFADLSASSTDRALEFKKFIDDVAQLPPDALVWGRTPRFWRQMLFSGVRPLWAVHRGPCLVLHGVEDRASVPWPGVERDAAAIPPAGGGCEVVPLPHQGHDTLRPETFARIDAWLEAARQATSAPDAG